MRKDAGYRETEKELQRIEKALQKEYKQAADEVQTKLNKYMESFAKQDQVNYNKVQDGKMTEQEYKDWRVRHIAIGERWSNLRDKLAEDYTKADKTARAITAAKMPDIYATNFNYTTYQIEHDAGINTAFTMYNRDTVNRLVKDNPQLLPKPSARLEEKIRRGEVQRYNEKSLQSALLQGLLQGESIPKMADRVAKSVGEKNYNSAVRNARTMVTGAQNGGRYDAMKRAESYGVKNKKQWLAAHDGRTRDSHRMLDYQIVPIDEPFGNDLMYPAEPNGDPAEVYNCRCAMRSIIDGLEPQARKYEDKTIEGQTYEEWKQGHAATKQSAEPKVKTAAKQELHATDIAGYERIKQTLDAQGVTYKEVEELTAPLTEEEIINKISGPDLTTGSCSSLAMAYCANKMGLDVTDYRGGNSREFFSYNYVRPYQAANAVIKGDVTKRECADASKILQSLPLNKEYVAIVGRHAAVVKNTADGLQFLELQGLKNGWVKMGNTDIEIQNMLHDRFGCTKTSKYPHMATYVDVDSMQKTEEFKTLMGYINTDANKQKKGAGGYAK